MRILFFATYPTQPTGYARIGNILSNTLATAGHEVYYLGISNFPNTGIERDVHPLIHLIENFLLEPVALHRAAPYNDF